MLDLSKKKFIYAWKKIMRVRANLTSKDLSQQETQSILPNQATKFSDLYEFIEFTSVSQQLQEFKEFIRIQQILN